MIGKRDVLFAFENYVIHHFIHTADNLSLGRSFRLQGDILETLTAALSQKEVA